MRGRDEAFPVALITISLRYFRFAMRSALNRGTHYITPRIVHKKGLIARSAKGSLCKTAHFANVALPELRGAGFAKFEMGKMRRLCRSRPIGSGLCRFFFTIAQTETFHRGMSNFVQTRFAFKRSVRSSHRSTESGMTKVSQETRAEMVGTAWSSVSYFLKKFRKLGFIDYNTTWT
jgi:hypothetical protein